MSIEKELGGLIGGLPEGLTEGVALGTGLADGYDLYETAIGEVVVTFNPDGVSSVDIADSSFDNRFKSRFGRSLLRAEAPTSWRKHIPTALDAGRPGMAAVDVFEDEHQIASSPR